MGLKTNLHAVRIEGGGDCIWSPLPVSFSPDCTTGRKAVYLSTWAHASSQTFLHYHIWWTIPSWLNFPHLVRHKPSVGGNPIGVEQIFRSNSLYLVLNQTSCPKHSVNGASSDLSRTSDELLPSAWKAGAPCILRRESQPVKRSRLLQWNGIPTAEYTQHDGSPTYLPAYSSGGRSLRRVPPHVPFGHRSANCGGGQLISQDPNKAAPSTAILVF